RGNDCRRLLRVGSHLHVLLQPAAGATSRWTWRAWRWWSCGSRRAARRASGGRRTDPARRAATAIAGLASRLGDGHDFQQMTVGIFKIESAASAASIDAFVLMAKRAAAVSDAFSFH